MGKMWPWKDDY
uniref:Uncharacterized protein n=1 Tax=Arundo donax TaxID=35708 RepID=A0A0A9GPH4_ARUDO